MSGVRLAAVDVPGEADAWVTLGFAVAAHVIPLANGAIRLGAAECRLVVADDVGVGAGSIEGIPVAVGSSVPTVAQPNGAVEFDHVVIMTDSLERTSGEIESVLGLEQRRMRETAAVRQAFHRFADADGTRGCIVEVVENPRVDRTSIWGLVVVVDDLDALVESAAGLVGAPKAAVQPGRRIATVSRSAGLPVAVAVMSR